MPTHGLGPVAWYMDINRGSQGIAWCVAKSAMIVPFVLAVAFLRNSSSVAQWTGLVLALASLVLFAKDKPTKGTATNDATYFRLVFASFALIGVGGFLRLIPGYAGLSPETLTWRLPLQSPVGMVFWTTTCLSKGIWKPGRVWKHSVPYAVTTALGQIAFYADSILHRVALVADALCAFPARIAPERLRRFVMLT